MGHVYGDSTPFPHDLNFIELIRHAVDCGVALLAAQHEITSSVNRSDSLANERAQEETRLNAMGDALRVTLTAFSASRSERLSRAASRVLEAAREVIEKELSAIEGAVRDQASMVATAKARALALTSSAIETLALKHDLPGTQVKLRLKAGEESYTGEAEIATPFGVRAVFALSIPTAHDWGRVRRVAEISAGTEVHVPMESGWLSKKVQLHPVKLDRMFVTEVYLGEEGAHIDLRKAPRSGSGFRIALESDAPSEGGEAAPTLRALGEDGQPSGDLLRLEGGDAMHAQRLWDRVVESTRDLTARREAMRTAEFDGAPLVDLASPQAVCERLIEVLSPVVREISRRSGAPGELVLRRDLAEGRREEIYITKAELHEKVSQLPAALRPIFDPFDLSEGPRSPRAPAPSEPIYVGIDVDLTPTEGTLLPEMAVTKIR